ncbi:hypothetical protein Y032_0005g2517 [Ancylostoma ceylanicum]|nr:hypothetical protein Y032_0005g2517 [Ancylostoma ceylanicum]
MGALEVDVADGGTGRIRAGIHETLTTQTNDGLRGWSCTDYAGRGDSGRESWFGSLDLLGYAFMNPSPGEKSNVCSHEGRSAASRTPTGPDQTR